MFKHLWLGVQARVFVSMCVHVYPKVHMYAVC